jgi:Ca2+-binding EF-hand superfamily protein
LADAYKLLSHPKQRVINRAALLNFMRSYYTEISTEDADAIFRYLGLERSHEIPYEKFIKFLYPVD